MAQTLQHAVVAIEDHRFFDHPGVDVRAMVRALATDLDKGEIAEGGSTITQQYVRNVMLNDDKTVHRKLREIALAVQLERRFTKAADPRALPEPRLLRQRRLRRAERGAALLRHAREQLTLARPRCSPG